MNGHLGTRVSALLDGQLPAAEADAAWEHVYACHACRDLVEREGWVKTRLAGLSSGEGPAPADLKGSLLSVTPSDCFLAAPRRPGTQRRAVGAAVLGGGAIGAAMVGVVALGLAGPGPTADRRPPASRIDTSSEAAPGAQAATSTSVPTWSPGRTSSVRWIGQERPATVAGPDDTAGAAAAVVAEWMSGRSALR